MSLYLIFIPEMRRGLQYAPTREELSTSILTIKADICLLEDSDHRSGLLDRLMRMR
jgi:hypothetical protein